MSGDRPLPARRSSDRSLAEGFELLWPHLSPALVEPRQRPRLTDCGQRLPAIFRGGFECRLGSAAANVDLQQCLHPDDLRRPGVAERLEAIEPRLLDWGRPSSPAARQVTDLWLEIDDQPRSEGGPSLILGLDPSASAGVQRELDELLDWLSPEALHQSGETLHRCLAALPAGGRVSHLGVMRSRPGKPVRLNVGLSRPDDAEPYLRRVAGDLDKGASALLTLAREAGSRQLLSLDIAGEVLPRLGIECFRAPSGVAADHELAALVERLVERRLCDPEKARGLELWPGRSEPPTTEVPWPTGWLLESLTRPADRFGLVDRRVNHLKLVWSGGDRNGGDRIGAKAYLWFHHHWAGLASAGDDIEQRVGSTPIGR